MAETVDILIPVSERPTIARTVSSLCGSLPSESRATIVICVAGPCMSFASTLTKLYSRQARVRVLSFCMPEFRKAQALNAALATTRGDIVLVSDADIVWRANAVRALLDAACSGDVAFVANVREQLDQPRPPLTRVGYRVRKREGVIEVSVGPSMAHRDSSVRPGPGLVAARRGHFELVGGYNETLRYWGWEDMDFLMRAEILGLRVLALAEVQHLTHDDRLRAVAPDGKLTGRDANIRAAVARIRMGRLWGDLPGAGRVGVAERIDVRISDKRVADEGS